MSDSVFQAERDGMTDAEWQALLARASGDGRRFFSENQLYLVYARNKVAVSRQISRRGKLGLCIVVVGIAAWVLGLKSDQGFTLVFGIALTLGGVGLVGTGVVTRRDPASHEPVTRWLAKWTAARGAEKLIGDATLHDAGLEYVPAVVRCVVIVERDPLVDLLLKNGAHSALNALIVAESGYPAALAAEARRLLESRADLKVIAVHDATFRGIAMTTRLYESSVFPLAQRRVLDAGLFPADVTWLSELAPAIPASHASRVPLDSLSFDALLIGLRGVAQDELSLYSAIDAARAPQPDEHGADSSSEPAPAQQQLKP